MAHPLIRKGKSVSNDISFQQEKFIVLTGSNMSGKSTFLRTMGTNIVLARAGSVVCAKKFILFPFDLYVSMRITDSLQDSESFFYAELKRLQQIIHHLEAKNKTFVMLDEILRGTNSFDRRIGAEGIVRALVELGAVGLVTTHDLALTELSSMLGEAAVNMHFEDRLEHGRMIFDYRMRPGVVEHSNALALMRAIGLDV